MKVGEIWKHKEIPRSIQITGLCKKDVFFQDFPPIEYDFARYVEIESGHDKVSEECILPIYIITNKYYKVYDENR